MHSVMVETDPLMVVNAIKKGVSDSSSLVC